MVFKHASYVVILSFISLLLIGTFGFVLIEGYSFLDAIYMAVITATTIGFGEVAPLSDAGKIFTIFLSISSVSLVFVFFGILSQSIFLALRSRNLLEVESDTLPVFLPAHEFFKPGKNDKLTILSLPANSPLVGKTKLAVLTHHHILLMAVKEKENSFTIDVPMDYLIPSHKKLIVLARKKILEQYVMV